MADIDFPLNPVPKSQLILSMEKLGYGIGLDEKTNNTALYTSWWKQASSVI